MTKKQVIQLINNYWKFDNDQDTTSTWHDKQDLINEIEQLEEMQKAGVSQQRELLEDYQHFIDWNEEHDRKASTSERIESFIASNCG